MYKKIIVNIFLIISILILSGCGAAQCPNGELSGIPFSYYKNIHIMIKHIQYMP